VGLRGDDGLNHLREVSRGRGVLPVDAQRRARHTEVRFPPRRA
jgi:hypothetical protein